MRRPFWINAVFLFFVCMTFVYLPYDLFVKPIAEDEDVWFGFTFYGWLAKLGGLAHWFVYASLTYGLWTMSSWVRPWICLYLLQVAWSMLLWAALTGQPGSVGFNLIPACVFISLSIHFYRNKSMFKSTLI